MCGSCSGDSRKCDCEQPPAKKQKKGKGRRAAEQEQLQEAAAPGSPEAEPNYKSVCRQLQQKNHQLGKAYQHLKAEAVTTGVGGCLLFLEGSLNKKQMAPLGATKFEKVNDQLNKV